MEVQDGFIVGLDNYCDRWCETCRLTSYCRSFALEVELEARHDPNLAGARTQTFERLLPRYAETVETAEPLAARPRGDERSAMHHHEIKSEHRLLMARAEAYAFQAAQALPQAGSTSEVDRAIQIIARSCFFACGKIYRALIGVAQPWGDGLDANGSAKAAMLALDRSQAAWRRLIEASAVRGEAAGALIADLNWLGRELERLFPHARAFVRPGLDEPEAVGRLLASNEG
jgi:hypothetical protein